MYLGLEADKIDLAEDIIKKGNVKDFEQFLNKAGIECNLTVVREFDKDILAFNFEGKVYPFFKVASHGTKTLILFYFWLQRYVKMEQYRFYLSMSLMPSTIMSFLS
jgi:hypothetical protein